MTCGPWLSILVTGCFTGHSMTTMAGSAVTDKYLIAQCFYANSVQLMINAAKVLNKNDEAATYSALLQRIKECFFKRIRNTQRQAGIQHANSLCARFKFRYAS
jgi:hypothetical protein